MTGSPVEITFYDENDEEKETYKRMIIPWGMLKRALKFKDLDESNMNEKSFDELANFVCELFCNKFTTKDIDKYADVTQVFAVFRAVVARAQGYFPQNPNQQAGN